MDLTDWLRPQLPRFLADLRALTAIDSGTQNPRGVNAVGDVMARRLADLGCEVRRYPCPDAKLGDSVAGTLRGRGAGRLFIFGHLDTVFAEGTAAERPLRVEDGRAMGPGACDMKGGLLAGLYALQALQAARYGGFGEITFFCTGDEEINSPCSKHHYLPLVAGADAALVLEAGWPIGDLPFGALTVARKGGGRMALHVIGREAHAGAEFERGASAILALARKIEALAALTGRWPGVTVNVGTVRGGSGHNVVAGHAFADIDLRVERVTDVIPLENACREIAARVDVPGTTGWMEGGIVKPPMERSASAWLTTLAHREAAALGFQLAEFSSGGTSDASYLAAAGVPVLDGLGPVGALDHSPEEYLLVESVVPRIALLARLIMAIGR